MHKRIGGVEYDSRVSRVLLTITSADRDLASDIPRHDPESDKGWFETLYVKPRGELWMYAGGGCETKYMQTVWIAGTPFEKNGYKLTPRMTWDDVRAWITSRKGSLAAEAFINEQQDLIDKAWEEKQKKTVCMYLPVEAQRRLGLMAERAQTSNSKYLTKLIYDAWERQEDEDLGLY